jgi:hypothetical protein
MLLSFIPYAGWPSPRAAGLVAHPAPVAYTLQHFERVIVETPKYIVNSFLYSGWRWSVHRGGRAHRVDTRPLDHAGRGALDAINTLILAVPAPPRHRVHPAFHFDLPALTAALTSFWIVMPLSSPCAVPYTVRGAFPRSSSCTAPWRRRRRAWGFGRRAFRDVTLPLIWKGIVVAASSRS